jgi:hypothetical protein
MSTSITLDFTIKLETFGSLTVGIVINIGWPPARERCRFVLITAPTSSIDDREFGNAPS